MATRFIEVWLLPPGIFIAMSLGLAALRAWRWYRDGARGRVRGVLLPALLACALWGLSTEVVASLLITPLEERIPRASDAELAGVAAVVVLGGGASTRDGGTLTAESVARLVTALPVARSLSVPIVVSGGRPFAGADTASEGEVAAATIERLGGHAPGVIVEGESRSTGENALFTRDLLASTRVAVATSAWHMPRAILAFERAGLDPVAIPGPWRSDRRPFHPVMLLPTSGSLETSSLALRERLGALWYRVRW